jgi:hypothetical protein
MSSKKFDYASDIIDRLKEHTDSKTDGELAEILGSNKNTIAGWRFRGSIDIPLVLEKCKNINLHWLITGEGNPHAPESKSSVSVAELELLRQIKDHGIDVGTILSLMLEVALLAEQKGFVLDWDQIPLTLMKRKLTPAEEMAGIRLGMPVDDKTE